MKNYLFTFLMLLGPYVSSAQILKNVNLDLNSGGVVHDVAFDSFRNVYVVVGEFTSVQGQSRNNIAFIDASNFTVTAENLITGINGAIRSIEIYRQPQTFPLGANYFIYLGGEFTEVNTLPHVFMARFSATEQTTFPFGIKLQFRFVECTNT